MLTGSPKAKGNTALALSEMEKIFLQGGIEVKTVQVGNKTVRGSIRRILIASINTVKEKQQEMLPCRKSLQGGISYFSVLRG